MNAADVVNMDLGAFSNIPQWAQNAIMDGIYQKGRADALMDVFETYMGKLTPK